MSYYLRQASFPYKTRLPSNVAHIVRGAFPLALLGGPRPRQAAYLLNPKNGLQRRRRSRKAAVMVLTESRSLELGTKAPAFTVNLPTCLSCKSHQRLHCILNLGHDIFRILFFTFAESLVLATHPLRCLVQLPEPLTGRQVSLDSLAEGVPALLVMFICNHCPFVVLLKEAIVQVCKEYKDRGVAAVAINSNSIQTHPQDGPERMVEDVKTLGEALHVCLYGMDPYTF